MTESSAEKNLRTFWVNELSAHSDKVFKLTKVNWDPKIYFRDRSGRLDETGRLING